MDILAKAGVPFEFGAGIRDILRDPPHGWSEERIDDVEKTLTIYENGDRALPIETVRRYLAESGTQQTPDNIDALRQNLPQYLRLAAVEARRRLAHSGTMHPVGPPAAISAKKLFSRALSRPRLR